MESTTPLDYFASERNFAATVSLRIRSGELRITIEPPNWQAENYEAPYTNRSMPLVRDISNLQRDANDFHVYYDPSQDFHHVTFRLHGDEYDIRWYKIAVVTRKSDGKEISFGYRYHDVGSFFGQADYRTKYWS